MICFKTDLFKNGIIMGVIISILSIAMIVIGSPEAILILSTITIVLYFVFPIIMGIKHKKSLPSSTPYGFWKAYRYSYSILFVAYLTIIILFAVAMLFLGKNMLAEFVIEMAKSYEIHLTQENIDLIVSVYGGYSWITYAAIKLFVSPAICGIIPALFIRRKKTLS